MKTLSYDMQNFRAGLVLLNDDSTAPVGSARVMSNISITDRGGISPRPGTTLLGTPSTGTRGRGFFVFKKAYSQTEIPMRAHDDLLEAYDAESGWFTVKENFDPEDKEFGFVSNFVTTENEDYVYFCNRFSPFQRWNGQIAIIETALVGAETSIVVDSTLRPDVFSRTVATVSSTTQLSQTTETWGVNQWAGMWVYIVDGTQAGRISKITSNTATQITFAALPVSPGIGTTFEIRVAKFDISKNSVFVYNSQNITVTGIPTSTTLTVASAHAAPAGTPLTNAPQGYPAAPRGNRITTLRGRTFVGRVRSGLSRDGAGALQGSNVSSSIFGTKLLDPTSFEFASPRVASEGIVAAIPSGGGDINDIAVFENVLYIYKKNYIESFYMQESDDSVRRDPLKSAVGSIGRVIVGRDDHYFVTLDNQFTSLGRLEGKDFTPATQNIGYSIKRLLDVYDFSDVCGVEYRNRILISAKESVNESENNVTLVWNRALNSFEGVWNIGAHQFDTYNDDLYYQSSINPNVYKMFDGTSRDLEVDVEVPITSEWKSNFFNLLPIKGNVQSMESLALEGYISANTEFTVSLFKDFESEAFLEFTFGGLDDEQFLVGTDLASFLGSNPLALQPLGILDQVDAEGVRRFQFLVYFPYTYGQYFSLGIRSSGINQNYEVIRATLGLRESISVVRDNIRSY